MGDKTFKVIAVLALVVALAGSGYAIVRQPAEQAVPRAFSYPAGAIYFAEGGTSQVFQSGASATYNSGATLTASSGSTVTLAGSTDLNSATVVTTTALAVNGLRVSGAYKYGCTSATVAGGAGGVAHGVGTTPTAVLISPYGAVLTTTVSVTATDTISFYVGYAVTAAAPVRLCWFAGK
jgi:hypothetical protein